MPTNLTSAAKRPCLSEEQIEEEGDIMSQYALAAGSEAAPIAMAPTSPGVLDGKGVFISRQFSEKNQNIAVETVRGNGGRIVDPHRADYLLTPLEGAGSEDEWRGAGQSGSGIPITMAWLVSGKIVKLK